jgi:hypothetical protein
MAAPERLCTVTKTLNKIFFNYCRRNRGSEQCWGSVTFGADPDPTLDPAPFFREFKDAKKAFFLITHPQAHSLQS